MNESAAAASSTHLVLIPSYNPGARVFATVRAARKWFTWLSSVSYVAQVNLYRGNTGEELLDQIGR